jgi:hypothetical protein
MVTYWLTGVKVEENALVVIAGWDRRKLQWSYDEGNFWSGDQGMKFYISYIKKTKL